MVISRLDLLYVITTIGCFVGLWGVWTTVTLKGMIHRLCALGNSHTMDNIIHDLKRAQDAVLKLKRTEEMHQKLIAKLYQLLKDSIEKGMSDDEVLSILNETVITKKDDHERREFK